MARFQHAKGRRAGALRLLLLFIAMPALAAAATDVSGCGTLNASGGTYALTADLQSKGDCITIQGNGVTLDCNGFSISTNGTYTDAVSASGVVNATVTRCNLSATTGAGLHFTNSNGTVSFNNASTDGGNAFAFEAGSAGSVICGNIGLAALGSYAFSFTGGSGANTICNNTAQTADDDAFHFEGSGGNVLEGNNASAPSGKAYYFASSGGNNLSRNLCSGSPGCVYFTGSGGNSLRENACNATGGVAFYFEDSEGNAFLRDQGSSLGGNAFEFHGSGSNSISGVTAYSADFAALQFTSSPGNGIEGSSAEGLGGAFAFESESGGNALASNNATASGDGADAFSFSSSEENNLTGNRGLATTGTAFNFLESGSNRLVGNTGSSGGTAFSFQSDSGNNTLSGNLGIASSGTAFGFSSSGGNSLSGNNASSREGAGFRLYDSGGNAFSNDSAAAESGNAFSFESSGGNSLSGAAAATGSGAAFSFSGNSTGNTCADSAVSCGSGFCIGLSNSSSASFSNASFTSYRFAFGDSTSRLNVTWFLDVTVEDATGSGLAGADVVIKNSTGHTVFTGQTADDGSIVRRRLLHPLASGFPEDYAYYEVNASKPGYSPASGAVYLNSSFLILLQLLQYVTQEAAITPAAQGPGSANGFPISLGQGIPSPTAGTTPEATAELETPTPGRQNPSPARARQKPVEKPEEKRALFDVVLRLLRKEVSKGDKFTAVIGLVNLGDPGAVNASLEYSIVDASGNVVYAEKEVKPVETRLEFIKEILPDLAEGNYLLKVDLYYPGQTEPAQAAESISIVGRGTSGALLGGIAILAIAALALAAHFAIRRGKTAKILHIKREINAAVEPPAAARQPAPRQGTRPAREQQGNGELPEPQHTLTPEQPEAQPQPQKPAEHDAGPDQPDGQGRQERQPSQSPPQREEATAEGGGAEQEPVKQLAGQEAAQGARKQLPEPPRPPRE